MIVLLLGRPAFGILISRVPYYQGKEHFEEKGLFMELIETNIIEQEIP